MTLYQFNSLDETEQIQAVWRNGVLLADRADEMHEYSLYQIDSFYVETRSFKGGRGYNGLRSFFSTDLLEPYLDKIKIK